MYLVQILFYTWAQWTALASIYSWDILLSIYLDNEGIKGLLKEDGEMAEKMYEFFASVYSVENEEELDYPGV